MKKETKVEAIQVSLHCDKCPSEPELIYSNIQLTSNPPQYLYKCPKCQHETFSPVHYPHIRYQKINHAPLTKKKGGKKNEKDQRTA